MVPKALGRQPLHELGEVRPGELPLEGPGRLLIAPLEGDQPSFDLSQQV